MNNKDEVTLGRFEKYIYLWIVLCAAAGLFLGKLFPQEVRDLNALNIGGVSIPIAVLMFFLMYPTMAKVRLEEVSHAVKNTGPTILTLIANWIIAPPLMVLLATLFLRNPDFRAGAILLGISPCTGMVLFWIAFARGNVTQGVVITAINAVSTLLLYAPFTAFYLGVGGVPVPFSLVVSKRAHKRLISRGSLCEGPELTKLIRPQFVRHLLLGFIQRSCVALPCGAGCVRPQWANARRTDAT